MWFQEIKMEKKERVLSICLTETNRLPPAAKETKDTPMKLQSISQEIKYRSDISSLEIDYESITLRGKVAQGTT